MPEAYKATDEFEQMTAERLMPIVVNGRQQFRWMLTPGKRNEAGDCMVLSYAAAVWLGLPTFREASWSRREEKYAPREPGLFDAAGSEGAQAGNSEPNQPPAHTESAQNAAETIAKQPAQEPAPAAQPTRATLGAAPVFAKPQFTRKW